MDMRSDVVKMFFFLGWKGAYSLVQENFLGKGVALFEHVGRAQRQHATSETTGISRVLRMWEMRISVIKFEEQNPWKLGACAFWAWASRLHYLLCLMLWWDGWAGLYTTSSYLQIPWDTPVNKDRNRKQDLLKISEN